MRLNRAGVEPQDRPRACAGDGVVISGNVRRPHMPETYRICTTQQLRSRGLAGWTGGSTCATGMR